MGLFSEIRSAFSTPKTQSLAQLSHGLCALPLPAQRVETVKKAKPKDLYVIDEKKAEFGFHQATAIRQNEGSIPNLTSFDLQLLKNRGYWAKGKSDASKASRAKTETCKHHWHGDETEKESATALGVSLSWVEKRYGTFTTALSEEVGKTPE